jgi:hypothetical protein
MKINIIIPSALRVYTNNQSNVELDGNSVSEVLEA